MATIRDAMAIGWRLFRAGEMARADGVCRKVLEIDPAASEAWQLIGAIHHVRGNDEEAVKSYRHVLRLEPNHVEALNNLGVALRSQGQTDEAIACFQRAVTIDPAHADAHSNLGNALHEDGQYENAVACYRHALQFDPRHFDAHNNLGNTLRALGTLTESIKSYERALALRPDDAQVHLSRSLCWLQMGDFERGWAEYEWRLKCKDYAIPSFRQPVWDGSALDGHTILLYADHGMGDSIQFVRYAPRVKERGGRVIVACQQPLARLMPTCPGVDQVVVQGSAMPDFDVYAPLMSLPRVFGTRLSTIPAEVPYLIPDAGLVERWRGLTEQVDGFKVGIAWQGNPQFRGDRLRSFRLAQFEPLAHIAGVRLVSIQKGAGSEQIAELGGRFPATDLGSQFADFMDTAAVMLNLDLVITSDSSRTHLAGALGIPTWVAIPVATDWRWMTEGETNPWYPTMRLFRQTRTGDWDDVFERIAGELRALIQRSAEAKSEA
jgi:Tfp pilus assembly protein PilF